jgi:hypothetical protein
VSFAAGLGAILVSIAFKKKRLIGVTVLASYLTMGALSILGMLQIGPLTNLLYKDSVSVRGYYFRAGIRMLKENFFTGVGIDRYGIHFKEYREVGYPLRYGFDIVSTNAHNVPIQFLATGGFFVGFFYLLLVGAIGVIGVRGLVKLKGNDRMILTMVFAGWVTYQSQSLISIDNIGLAIWGWSLGGLVVVFSRNPLSNSEVDFRRNQLSRSQLEKNQILSNLTSSAFLLISISLITVLYKGESAMIEARKWFNPQAEVQAAELKYNSEIAVNLKLLEPAYKLVLADYIKLSGDQKQTEEIVDSLLKADPINLDYLNYRAILFESTGDYSSGIKIRERIVKMDPWDARNYLQMGRNYKMLGDFANMSQMLDKLSSFAVSTNEYEIAKSEFIIN